MNGKTIIIKIGTSTITHENGTINIYLLDELCKVISDLQNIGHRVLLVTSGAVGVGISKLHLDYRPTSTRERQAVASVGQCELMMLYQHLFAQYNHTVAQLLLTRDVVDNNISKDNVINTINTLFKLGVVPIANENDTVSTDELKGHNFGDNDMLSSIVASLVKADMLIILTDTDGLYTSNPKQDITAKKLSVVSNIDKDIINMAGGSSSVCGTGGMITKVMAAKTATSNGVVTYIINGNSPKNIYEAVAGNKIGTVFLVDKNRRGDFI